LTVNVTAVILAFVSSIASNDEKSALTAVQLLWVNLIMDTFAALALATDPPTLELLNRKPEPRGSSIISFNMWKMIFGQAILQLVITFVLNFAGRQIFTGWDKDHMQTVVFNTFVWLQIFNEINCRRLDNKLNVFSGMQHNPFFIAITCIMIGGQVLIVFVGGTAFSVTPITGEQWAACIVLGLLSLPFGVIIRLIPNEFIKIFIPRRILEHRRKATIIDEEMVTDEWNPAIDDVRDDLLFIKKLRSKRRLGSLGNPKKAIRRLIPTSSPRAESPSHQRRPSTAAGSDQGSPSPSPSPRRQRSRSNSAFNAATMVPALVATSMMWSPSSPSEGKMAQDAFPITMSRQDLEKVEGVELHKDTHPQDPIVGGEAAQYNPLEINRPRSPVDEKPDSSKGHWRGRLSVHSRATSKSSVTSLSPGSPTGGGLAAPRRDVSRESRASSRTESLKGSAHTEEKREGI
jgi:Ca2+-transporting ATPase